MPDYRVTREQVINAVSRGKDWLLQNQITPATTSYDTFVETAPKQGYWTEAPVAKHLIGGFYGNIWRNPIWAKDPKECRRQYHSTWHAAQCGVALLDYLDYNADPTVQKAVDLTWDFLQRHWVPEGPFKGVFVERELKEMPAELKMHYTFSTQNPKSASGYASYDNMETNLFPLELFRRTNNPKALEMARANCQFYLDRHPEDVFSEVEHPTHSITGMNNDACYGRLAKYTDNRAFYDVFVKQIQKLNLMGLDLRAGNNIRNMYWDCTAVMYAVDEYPELRPMSMAKLAFLCEHTLGAQKESGALWHRYAEPGVVDRVYHQNQDGAATSAMITCWAKMYDVTGDPRWLEGIRKAIHFAVSHQYPANDHPYFAGAFEYEEDVMRDGQPATLLRGVSTALGVRSMLQLLKGEQKWAKDFWA